MKLSDLFNIQITKNYINEVITHKEYNKTIIKYYERLSHEDSTLNLASNIDNLSNCNSWWSLDHYKEQKVKDFKKTNLCKDKFCNNCKKVKQASRMTKFVPLIEEFSKDKYLYHVVLTVPNCNGTNLKDTIKTIFKSFYSLNRYLNLNLKIKGLDFEQYGYSGSIRSLEVTFNHDDYHPHLHCIIALDKPLDDNRHIKNTYSKSRKNGYRKFTDFEILIQKIWYLLNNGHKVTKKNIDELDIGYSCTVDSIDESSLFEVFKYMTKTKDEKNNILTYDNFKTLYFALHRVRQIQGYGCFYNVKDDDSIINEVDDFYNVIINILSLTTTNEKSS
ncbi:MAG: protein rep, partial [Lysinibacillus sp.]